MLVVIAIISVSGAHSLLAETKKKLNAIHSKRGMQSYGSPKLLAPLKRLKRTQPQQSLLHTIYQFYSQHALIMTKNFLY